MFRMCQMFHCLPSQLEEEDAEIIKMMNILVRGTSQEGAQPHG